MKHEKTNTAKTYLLQLYIPISIFFLLFAYGCKNQVALDGDYDQKIDSLLSSFPTLNAETQTITKADFAKAEILRAINHQGASNYKFVKSFLDKLKVIGSRWPNPKNFSNNSLIIDNSLTSNFNEVLTDNSLKLLNLYDTLRKNCLYLSNGKNFPRILNNTNIKQTKLGYNRGTKQFANKTIPCEYEKRPNICQNPFYGVDCSGFVYQAFFLSGLNFGKKPEDFANAEYFSDPSHYTKVLNAYFRCSSCYKVERINNAKYQDLRAGDCKLPLNSVQSKV